MSFASESVQLGVVRNGGVEMRDEASYLRDGCGEEIVISIDLSHGDQAGDDAGIADGTC